jgi:hypothetical protein
MTLNDFENALQNPALQEWFTGNVDNLISGGRQFPRENRITQQIANLIPNVEAQVNYRDFVDNINGDIGEAAHNGTYQNATFGVEHMIKRFFQRYEQGDRTIYFGLLALLHVYLCTEFMS